MSRFCRMLGFKSADREYESFKRMTDSYLSLQTLSGFLNAESELLKLAKYDPEKDEFTFSPEFNERFPRNNRRGEVGMYLMYKIQLDKAARELERYESASELKQEKEAIEYSSQLLEDLMRC